MGSEKDENIQSESSQDDNNSSNKGTGLPPPDPDLSDYYKRDGDRSNVVKK